MSDTSRKVTQYAAGVLVSASVLLTGVFWWQHSGPTIRAEDVAALLADSLERCGVAVADANDPSFEYVYSTNDNLTYPLTITEVIQQKDVMALAHFIRTAVFSEFYLYNAPANNPSYLAGGYCIRVPEVTNNVIDIGSYVGGVLSEGRPHVSYPGISFFSPEAFTPALWMASHRWTNSSSPLLWSGGKSAINVPTYIPRVGSYYPYPPVTRPTILSEEEALADDWWTYTAIRLSDKNIARAGAVQSGIFPYLEYAVIEDYAPHVTSGYARPWPYFNVEPWDPTPVLDLRYRWPITTNTLNFALNIVTSLTTTAYFIPTFNTPPYSTATNGYRSGGAVVNKVVYDQFNPTLEAISEPRGYLHGNEVFAEALAQIGAGDPTHSYPNPPAPLVDGVAAVLVAAEHHRHTHLDYQTQHYSDSPGHLYYYKRYYRSHESAEAIVTWAANDWEDITIDIIPQELYDAELVKRIRCFGVFEVVPRAYVGQDYYTAGKVIITNSNTTIIDKNPDLNNAIDLFKFYEGARGGHGKWTDFPRLAETGNTFEQIGPDDLVIRYYPPIATNVVGSLLYEEQYPTTKPVFSVHADMGLIKNTINEFTADWTTGTWEAPIIDAPEDENYLQFTPDGDALMEQEYLNFQRTILTSVQVKSYGLVVLIDWDFTNTILNDIPTDIQIPEWMGLVGKEPKLKGDEED